MGTAHQARHPSDTLPIVTDAATAHDHETASEVLARLHAHPAHFSDVIHVVDAKGRLHGAVALASLVTAPPRDAIVTLKHAVHAVTTEADPEQVASQALRRGMVVVPVVDHGGHFQGVVTGRALMEVLRREHVEDLHRMAGIRRETAQARIAVEAPPMRSALDRLPWLLVGLVGSMLATLLVASFEAALQAKIALAFFVPAIVYLADAIGTQTEAIVVRGLSLSHVPMRTLVWGEMRTGLLVGAALGALAWPAAWLAFGDMKLASTVALSLVVAGTVATTIGLLLPWAFARLGRDPAFGSGPIATIVQDVLSLAIYFAIASLLLH
ncbi:MAG: magnesium transporter [Burkholderiaceae bacterium]|nr:magnesium transporter [Burkholderiaceae bacterium]